MSTVKRTRAAGLVLGAVVALVAALVVVLAMRPDSPPDEVAKDISTETSSAAGAPDRESGSAGPDAKREPEASAEAPQERTTPPRTRRKQQPAAPVPAVSKTDVDDRVQVRPQTLLDPVPTDRTVVVDDRVKVHVTAMRLTKAEAHGPGEISGRAVAVTVRLTSHMNRPFSLDSGAVIAFDAEGSPLSTLTTPTAVEPFAGRLPAGGHKDATYLFQLPEHHPTPITVTVSAAPALPVAVLVGDPT